jgi:hypothetical protein
VSPARRKLTLREVVDRLAAGLDAARWEYDAEADELEIVLPGGGGREGRAILLDSDAYLRLDVDTNEPLTVIIPAVSVWVGQQVAQVAGQLAAPPPADPRGAGWGGSHEAVALSLARSARASGALAAALP